MPRATSKPSTPRRDCSGRFDLALLGVSAGGVDLLLRLLPRLPQDFPVPIVVCIHAAAGTTGDLAAMLAARSAIAVKEAEDKESLRAGTVYLAPGGYHLHVERDLSCSLSLDAPVKFARPSVDVLFESAALACGERLLAAVLTGANDDGADGVRRVKARGGVVIVQDPESAHMGDMPRAALRSVRVDHVVTAEQLPALLQRLCGTGGTT